jgi:O-acetyl-ADP-ribose deacetylase (regulator of RNase III)
MSAIQHITGNLVEQHGILVHGCNCRGVMGAGVAAVLRARWPAIYDAYREKFLREGLMPGEGIVVASVADKHRWPIDAEVHTWSQQLPSTTMVVNLMTQKDYGRDPSRVYVDYEAVSRGFENVVKPLAQKTGLPVYFPKIGCGLANGDWQEVSKRIEEAMPPEIPLFLVELA